MKEDERIDINEVGQDVKQTLENILERRKKLFEKLSRIDVPSKKLAELDTKMKAIGEKTPMLTGEDNMVELDPKNRLHQEWYKDK